MFDNVKTNDSFAYVHKFYNHMESIFVLFKSNFQLSTMRKSKRVWQQPQNVKKLIHEERKKNKVEGWKFNTAKNEHKQRE